MRKWALGLLVVVLACSGTITFLVRQGNGSAPPPATATVTRGPIADVVVAIGSVQPDVSVSVKAKVSGVVEMVGAEPGDTVTKGQIIVELDKDILRGQVASADAEVAVANAARAQAQAEAKAAHSEHEFQEAEYRRATDLRDRGLISPQEVETARNRRRTASERALRADALQQAATARVQKAEVLRQLARDHLSYATLRSPMDGTLLSRPVEVGSAVADITAYDQTAFVVGDMRTLILDAEVDETEVGRVRIGQRARIQLEAFRDRQLLGRVTRIAPQGVEENHIVRFPVEITLDETDVTLRAELTGDAEIIVNEHTDALLVQERAIQYDFDGPFARRPGSTPDAEPEIVRLTLGFSTGEMAEVLEGLAEGDVVLLPDGGQQ